MKGSNPEAHDDAESTGNESRSGASHPLGVRAYRTYFLGQLTSNTGTWFQNLAISLVVLHETGSAAALSWVTIAQFTPIFLLSPLAGWLADNVPIRRILICTSSGSIVTSILLITVVTASPFQLHLLLSVVTISGTLQAMERIAAQSFVYELVGPELLKSGTVMASAYNSIARSIGPGLAGVAFAAFGPMWCLVVNACSYAAVVVAMLLIKPTELHSRIRRRGDEPKMKFRSLPLFRIVLTVLIVNCLVTVTAMNMNVVLTTLVTETLDGGAEHLGVTHALNAVGSVMAAVFLSRLRSLSFTTLVPASLVFAVVLTMNALAPSLWWLLGLAPLLGVGISMFHGTINAVAQSSVPPAMIGRTMSLVVMGTFGSIPVGALLSGWLIDAYGARTPFLVGAVACCVAAVAVWIVARSGPRRGQSAVKAS